MKKLSPIEIENESMRIIDSEAGTHGFSAQQWPVVRRVIHATADFEFMKTMRFHPDALAAGLQAIRAERPIYTDTNMLAAAIRPSVDRHAGCPVLCFISDEDVVAESRQQGATRSAVAMRKAAALIQGGIVAIGNAPTALNEAVALCEQGVLNAALIIGMPVGFVGALESKELLNRSGGPFITNLDRKGGTPATAAVVNALIKLAGEQ